MTDHAKELRRHARKIGRPSGDIPAVMHAAAEHIEKLELRLHGLEWDVTYWRANHAAEVHRARVLKERPDMPLERVEAYKQIGELLARVAELEAEREEREPVAWYCDGEDGREYNGSPQMSNGRTGTPLYATPPVTAQAEGYVNALRYIAWESSGYMDCVHAAKQAIGETGALPPPPKIQPARGEG